MGGFPIVVTQPQMAFPLLAPVQTAQMSWHWTAVGLGALSLLLLLAQIILVGLSFHCECLCVPLSVQGLGVMVGTTVLCAPPACSVCLPSWDRGSCRSVGFGAKSKNEGKPSSFAGEKGRRVWDNVGLGMTPGHLALFTWWWCEDRMRC